MKYLKPELKEINPVAGLFCFCLIWGSGNV